MTAGYCLLYKDQNPLFGFVKETRKNKLVVLPQRGSEIVISPSQPELQWQADPPPGQADIQGFLEAKFGETANRIPSFDLQTVWELSDPEEKTIYDFDRLCADFLENPLDPWLKVSFFLALKNDSRLFKYRKGKFVPRSTAELSDYDAIQQKAAAAKMTEDSFSEWLRELKQNNPPTVPEEKIGLFTEFTEVIEKIAAERQPVKAFPDLSRQLVGRLEDTPENDLFFLEKLALLGKRCSWGKLQIRKAGVRRSFPNDVINQSAAVLEADEPGLRTDETRLACFTVDSKETRDFDDALSVETVDGKTVIRLHITDVAAVILPESPIWKESERRISSVYTPLETIPMIPANLSENRLSLIAGAARPVVTYAWHFDPSLALIAAEAYPATVSIRKNLTYDEVDAAIEVGNDAQWQICLKVAHQFRLSRIQNGAVHIHRNEVKVDISDPERITVQTVPSRSPSRQIIEEFAIAANRLTGELTAAQNTKGLFRFQDPYILLPRSEQEREPVADSNADLVSDINSGEGPTADAVQKPDSDIDHVPEHGNPSGSVSTLHGAESPDKPSTVNADQALSMNDVIMYAAKIGTEPQRHYGLGIDYYMQATSPLRRFQDLYNQHVLHAVIAGKTPAADAADLPLIADAVRERSKVYANLEKTLSNYWKYKYLIQNPGISLTLEFRRFLKTGKALLYFPEIDLSYEYSGTPPLQEKETAVVEIIDVQPLLRFIRFEVLSHD